MEYPLNISIEKQFSIIPKIKGEYHSFPTVVKEGNQLLMAVRSAKVDVDQPHGREGEVRLYHSTVDAPEAWQQVPLEFVNNGEWELDAILSSAGGQLRLVSRHFRHEVYNDCFLSNFKLEDLAKDKLLLEKMPIQIEEMNLAAIYGHLQQAADGALLLPLYGLLPGSGQITSPGLYHSYDKGKSWSLRSILVDSGQVGKYLNELSMVQLAEGEWLGLVRDNHDPCNMCQLRSVDDGYSWELKESGLYGHAPMLCKTPMGVVAIYRDVGRLEASVSIAHFDRGLDQWSHLGVVRSYSGNRYNGGYGDVVSLGANRIFVLYYLSDEDESPWVEGAVVELQ